MCNLLLCFIDVTRSTRINVNVLFQEFACWIPPCSPQRLQLFDPLFPFRLPMVCRFHRTHTMCRHAIAISPLPYLINSGMESKYGIGVKYRIFGIATRFNISSLAFIGNRFVLSIFKTTFRIPWTQTKIFSFFFFFFTFAGAHGLTTIIIAYLQ